MESKIGTDALRRDFVNRLNIILSDLYLVAAEIEQWKIIPAWKRVVAATEHLKAIKDRLGE